jgi:hypothetical protein
MRYRLAMREAWMMIVVAIAACGKGSSDKAAPTESESETAAVTDRALVAAPLETVNAKAGPLAFSIQLPMSLLAAPEVEGVNVEWEAKHGPMDAPSFTVTSLDTPLGPDDLGLTQPIGDDAADRVVARNEHLPGGGYLQLDQRKDHAFFDLTVCKPAPGGHVCCSVIQRTRQPIDGFAEMVGLAEKICRSVTPR